MTVSARANNGNRLTQSPSKAQQPNPAYNRDRGPVSVVALRLHAEL
jgi:hypothetical protein